MNLLNTDIHTFIVLLITGNMVTIALFYIYIRNIKKNIYDTSFIAGIIFQIIAWILFANRGVIPDIFTYQVANSMLAAGFFFQSFPIVSIRIKITKRMIYIYIFFLACTLINRWLPFRDENTITGTGSILVAYPFAASCYFILRSKGALTMLQRVIALLNGGYFVIMSVRGFYYIFYASYDLFKKDTLQVLSFYSLYLIMLIMNLGYILMKKEITDIEREKLIVELKGAIEHIKTLKGLIPICASCKKVRNDSGFWQHVEEYIKENTEADFSHGLCPDCIQKLYPGIKGNTKRE